MWNNPQAAGTVGSALGKGCLAGLGLAVLFALISLMVYLLSGPFGLDQNVRLLLTFASGPVLGTILALAVFWLITRRMRQR
jgi:hypothetical protein